MPPRKTPIPPPVYRPQPTPKVLQTKTIPGRSVPGRSPVPPIVPRVATAPTRPAPAPRPVHHPQTAPKVVQRKHPIAPPTPPVATKWATIQRAEERKVRKVAKDAKVAKPPKVAKVPKVAKAAKVAKEVKVAPYWDWMKDKDTFITELEKNPYLLHTGARRVGEVRNARNYDRLIKSLDMSDVKMVHPQLNKRLVELLWTVHLRPTPEHGNEEKNLPVGHAYYELGMEGAEAARLVYDASNGAIYFSWHYGQGHNAGQSDSPFIKLSQLTAAQQAVTKYKVIFRRFETAAYDKARTVEFKKSAAEVRAAADALEATVAAVGEYFDKRALLSPDDAVVIEEKRAISEVIKEMWDAYHRRVRHASHASQFVYLKMCHSLMRTISRTHRF